MSDTHPAMSGPGPSGPAPSDRRRDDRRGDFVSLSEYTVPELRKALVTIALLGIAIGLFIYMVSEVVVAVIAGLVAATYLLPLQRRLQGTTGNLHVSALLTIVIFTVPLLAILVYSWMELSEAAAYLNENSRAVVARLNAGLGGLPFADHLELSDDMPRWVDAVASSSGQIVESLRETVDVLMIGLSVFLFTTFYFLTDHERIRAYMRARIPGRYRSLTDPISAHIRAVIYGVLYGTFLTQLMKSAIILTMNLAWDVPLGIVLAIASFFIGLLPILGSWAVYTPVAAYLILWRGDALGGVLMLLIGFIVNTVIISMYLRPKIAAEKSEVLNFYWMFIALVTGVYTFGLMGIIIGPVLVAVLKAILDAISEVDETAADAVVVPVRSQAGI